MSFSHSSKTTGLVLCLATMLTGAASISSRADHGPGTSGGGASTQSAETLKPHEWSADLRLDYTEFEDVSDSQILDLAKKAGGFDSLDRSFLTSVTINYGVAENFHLGLSIGHYNAVRAREGEHGHGEESETGEEGEGEIVRFNPDGLTDLLLAGKYRFYRGPAGQFAAFGGVKFPTGRHDVRTNTGEPVEPSATAGSGAFDYMLGLAYSTYITKRVTLDLSGQYTLRTEDEQFKIGDRFDTGLAVAYRFTDDIEQFPQVSVFAEATVRHLQKSEERGERDSNTGGTALFLGGGLRARFSPHAAFTVSPQVPVVQDLNGEQLETRLRLVTALSFTF